MAIVAREMTLLALKIEAWGQESRNVAASRNWKGREMDLPLEPPEKNAVLKKLDFSPVRPMSEF